MGPGRSAFHQGQELCSPTKALYIGADQHITLIFRLRQRGGPVVQIRAVECEMALIRSLYLFP
jgi:hypothetical protein